MKGNEDACNVMPNSQDSGHATIDPTQIEHSKYQKQLGKYSFRSKEVKTTSVKRLAQNWLL